VRTLHSAAIAAFSSSLILAAASPAAASAADVTLPVITSVGIADGEAIGPKRILRPVVSDNVGVTRIDVYIDGAFVHNFGWQDGQWAGTVSLLDQVHDDEIDITLRVWDAARNISRSTVRVRVDLVAPTIGAILPEDNGVLGGTTPITSSDVSPDTSRVTLTYGYGPTAPLISESTTAPWTLRRDNTGQETSTVVYVTAEDRAGNTTAYLRRYRIDGVGPDIYAGENWIRPVMGPGEGIVAVNYYDPADVARVEWWVDGTLRSTDQVATVDFGKVNRTVDVEVRVFDHLGNVSSVSRKVRVDVTGPTITSVTPAQGALVRGNWLTTEVRATDASGLEPVNGAVLTDAYGNRQILESAPYRKSLHLADGPTRVTWTVYDRFGNPAVVRRDAIMDGSAPSVAVAKAPKNKAKVKGTVKVTASAWDRYGIARVQLLINGKVVATDYKAGYAFSINTRKYGKKIKFQLRAYDRAGNLQVTTARTWYR
jgi:hypothetical protein